MTRGGAVSRTKSGHVFPTPHIPFTFCLQVLLYPVAGVLFLGKVGLVVLDFNAIIGNKTLLIHLEP